MDKVIPYLISIDEPIPARSKAALLNEMAMGLIECITTYGKKIKKLGKINRISIGFWPVRLIPLSETRACVCSYLLNKQERLDVGSFSLVPPPPENIIKGADSISFLNSLQSYNSNYLAKTKNYKRSRVMQEALFSANEISYFKSFFLNQYNLSAFSEPYFLLEGEPIAKSVDQIKIVHEIYDFVGLKDVKMLDEYSDSITRLCNKWIEESSKEVDKIRVTTVDTKEEDKQLAILNKDLQAEKERKVEHKPEDLVKGGKYKIPDKTGELSNNLNAIRGSIERLKNGIGKNDLFLLDEGLKDLDLRYRDLGNAISRYNNEVNQLKRNIDRELSDIEKTHQTKIRDLERKISEVEKQIAAKHDELSKDLSSTEDIIVKIRQEKQSCLDNIELIKDVELTNVQQFLQNYTIEINTKNVVVGIPLFIFYFVDPNTTKTIERAPVMPLMIDRGKVVRAKIMEGFRRKIRDLMNKFTPMVNLVESEGANANLMDMKNLDTQLEESINDLRIRKILSKKPAETAKEMIYNLLW